MTKPLITAAHGTRSAAGLATIRRLIDLVRESRPGVDVDLCFLDVLQPSLRHRLESADGPAVVVPVLLSAGYHVADDIPSVVAPHGQITVARHLGPHRLITDALTDRLDEAGATDAEVVALVGSPSRHPDASADVAAAAVDLAQVLARPVRVLALDDALPDRLSALAESGGRVAVVAYLLGEGVFHDTLLAHAARARVAAVTNPIGAHPAIARLILQRYGDALG
jgi:sirohydrochlorin ferrochelatase